MANAVEGWVFKKNWLTATSICDWELVGCSREGRVKILALSFNNLTGTVPPSISNLESLEDLDLEHNQMHGSLPVELTTLNSLVEIGLGGNSFSGVLPAALCDLSAVAGPACDLSGNRFGCPLPDCLDSGGACQAKCV
jgi:hypothetical protein